MRFNTAADVLGYLARYFRKQDPLSAMDVRNDEFEKAERVIEFIEDNPQRCFDAILDLMHDEQEG